MLGGGREEFVHVVVSEQDGKGELSKYLVEMECLDGVVEALVIVLEC